MHLRVSGSTTPGSTNRIPESGKVGTLGTGFEPKKGYDCRVPSIEVSTPAPGTKTMRLMKKSYRTAGHLAADVV